MEPSLREKFWAHYPQNFWMVLSIKPILQLKTILGIFKLWKTKKYCPSMTIPEKKYFKLIKGRKYVEYGKRKKNAANECKKRGKNGMRRA